MPYQEGSRLPAERASRLGHLDVLKSEHVNALVDRFVSKELPEIKSDVRWERAPERGKPLRLIFGIDGSVQNLMSPTKPHKRIAFVKTALLRMDQYALSKVEADSPHPFKLRDILADSALYHATIFPLQFVSIPGENTYHTIRRIIFDSIKDQSLNEEPYKTLKWIAYEKWNPEQNKALPKFRCPHCFEDEATLPYDADIGKCPNCYKELFLTDMLGFHQVMDEESAPDSVATDYMNIHEVLFLFTGVRYFWENRKQTLTECLFVKDGPLSIRAQYSKLVSPIRRFLAHAKEQGYPVHMIGQEKSGRFYDHLQLIGKEAPVGHLFIPSDRYIKSEIQHRPSERSMPYGRDTNFGVKVFVKYNQVHQMVLNIPCGEFKENPNIRDLIGVERIVGTLPSILSNRFEGALLPIELAHGIASLSTYPSAQILKIFAESKGYL